MKKKRIKRFLIVLVSGLAIASAVAYGIYAFQPKAESATAVNDENSVANVTVNDLENLKLNLMVNLDQETLSKMFTEFKKDFLDNSMPIQNGKRTAAAAKVGWSKEGDRMHDAVSFPFSAVKKGKNKYDKKDIESMRADLQEEIMRNPVMGDMILQGMKELKLSDKTKILDLNETWAKDLLKIYKQYGCGAFLTYHTKYWERNGFELPHDNEDIEAWKKAHPDAPEYSSEDLKLIYKDAKSPKLFVTDYYSDTAKRILAWLDRCQLVGVETYSTVKHFPLKNVENANQVRTYLNKDKSYVDSAPALIFTVTLKNKTQLLFGFNIYDKRFEIFEKTAKIEKKGNPNPKDEDNPKPDKTKKKKPEPEPKKDKDPTPDKGEDNPKPDKVPVPDPVIPTPVPDPTPNPNPNPIPDGKKDPKKDPVHQGNAATGEGIGKTPDKPVPDPSKRDMEDAHGGEDKNQGHSDPKTVLPTAPEPPKDSGKIDRTDENKMNYGEEDHKQKDSVTDKNGNVSNPDEKPSGGEFSEPGL